MRVCVVSREGCSRGRGELARYAWEAAAAWAGAGHEVHIVYGTDAPKAGIDPADLRAFVQGSTAGGRVIFHKAELTPDSAVEVYPTSAFRFAMAVYGTLKRLHAADAFDYIEFPLSDGPGYFALRGKRTLGHFAGATLGVRVFTPSRDRREANNDWYFDLATAFRDHMETATLREADILISPTASLLRAVRERVESDNAWPVPQTAVVPLPMHPPASLPPAPPAPRAAVAEKPGTDAPVATTGHTVLFCAPIERRLGALATLSAVEALVAEGRDLRLRYLGADTPTAPFQQSMTAMITKRTPPRLAERVEIQAVMPSPAEVAAAMAGARAVCLPAQEEGPTYAMLDALAAGSPAVFAGTEGAREYFGSNEPALLCDGTSAEALADALRRAVGDEGVRARLAGAGPAFVAAACDPAGVVEGTLAAIARIRRTPAEGVEAALAEGDVADVQSTEGPAAEETGKEAPAASEGPELSVVLTVFNLGAYLPQTLESLKRQTFRSYELIIVDDGSTDGHTLAVLQRLEAEGYRIVRKANGGCATARNAGIRQATGRFLICLDADDMLHETYFESCVRVLRSNPRLTYASPVVRTFESDPAIPTGGWIPLGMAGFDRDLLLVLNIGGIGAGSVFVRDAVVEAGMYDEMLPSYEDWDLWCRLAARGARGAIIPEFLFYYRIRQESKYRVEGLTKHQHLKSYIISRHAADGPTGLLGERTLRLQFGDAHTARRGEQAAEAQKALAAKDLAEARKRIAELEARERQIVSERESANGTIASLEVQVEELQAALAKITAQTEATEHRNRELETSRAALERIAAAERGWRLTAEEQADGMRGRVGELQRLYETEHAQRVTTEHALNGATNQILNMSDRLARLSQEHAALQAAVAEARRQIDGHDCSAHTRAVLAENARYRAVDKVNNALKSMGVQSTIKVLVTGRRGAANGSANGKPH